jgi:hypothetical protein
VFQSWLIGVAVAGVVGAASLWLALLRPAALRESEGTLKAKTFEAGHSVFRQPAPSQGGTMPPRQDISYGDRYVLEIQLDDGTHVLTSLPDLAGENYRVGERVRVKYQMRGIPPLWRRTMVYETQPVER